MSGALTAELLRALNLVSNSDLVEFEIKDGGATARLTFSFAGFAGGEGVEWVVCLYGIEELQYKRYTQDASLYVVVEASLEDAGDSRYRFKLAGEIELEAVCHSVNVLKPLSELTTAVHRAEVAVG